MNGEIRMSANQEELCRALYDASGAIVVCANALIKQFAARQRTEHQEDAERIREAGRDLLAAVDALQIHLRNGESFASVRHNVRNTVGLVSGYAEILEDEVAPRSEASRELKRIQHNASRFLSNLDALSALVSDLAGENSVVDEVIHSLGATVSSRSESTLGRKVLLVDDNSDNRELVGIQLNRLGIEVVEARTGREALDALAVKAIDLVLLDLMLPDINGYDLLKRIKQDKARRNLSIIIISGVKDEQSAIRCIEAGASDYIVKPVNATLLRARVSSLLERKLWEDKELAYLSNLEASYDFIRKVFGRYLSNDVMQRLLYHGDGLTLGGERREVTIMLADIRSFSVISQQLAPEDCVRLLNNYFAVMTDIIMSFQGTVDEFIGDGILAIFGAPMIDPRHSDHAVSCALAMQNAMPRVNQYNRANGLPEIDIGIGLNTGPVVVGNVGSELRTKYGVVGHHVNIASRIESCTVGGQVLASAYTVAAMQAEVHTHATLEVDVKGCREPLKLHDLRGVGEPFNIHMARDHAAPETLAEPVALDVRLLQGERLSRNHGLGRLLAVCQRNLIVEIDMSLSSLEEVQLMLPDVGESSIAYARVMGQDGEHRYHMTLTSSVGKMSGLLEQLRTQSP